MKHILRPTPVHSIVQLALAASALSFFGCDDEGGHAPIPDSTIADSRLGPDLVDGSDSHADAVSTPDGRDGREDQDQGGSDAARDGLDQRNADQSADTGSADLRELDTTADMGVPGADPAECRLPWGGIGTGLGFPTPDSRLHSVGTVTAKVLFVDFPDVAADRTPSQAFDMLSPGAETFWDDVSYGRLELVLEPHLEWLRLGSDSAVYGASLTSFVEHRAWVEEAVTVADPDVDFSATDLVVVIATPNATAITFGPTYNGVPGWEIEADGQVIYNGMTSGTDLLYWGSRWLNHEMGHNMGLPDLYEYGTTTGFTRPFSFMDLIDSDAAEPLAWERWQLGWLDDNQIVCNPDQASAIALTPIELSGGTKALIARTGDSRAVVVESRRALGHDANLMREGVVVSIADSSIATGSGPIRVANDQSALVVGESVTVDGVTVEVVSSSEDGDVVRVTR